MTNIIFQLKFEFTAHVRALHITLNMAQKQKQMQNGEWFFVCELCNIMKWSAFFETVHFYLVWL